jgi:hypothetical protein
MNFLQLTLAVLSAGLLANCASTPATRAEKRPAAFQAIPQSQRDTVLAGEIKDGMSRDAVWIAWGPPNNISQAGEDGTHYEIWRYTGLRPVYRSSIGMGLAMLPHGRGRSRHYHTHPYYDFNYGPDYVPYTEAVVKFREGKVKSWERINR